MLASSENKRFDFLTNVTNTKNTTATTTANTPPEKDKIIVGHGLMATESIRLQKIANNIKGIAKHFKNLEEMWTSIYDEFQSISIDDNSTDDNDNPKGPVRNDQEVTEPEPEEKEKEDEDDEDYELLLQLANIGKEEPDKQEEEEELHKKSSKKNEEEPKESNDEDFDLVLTTTTSAQHKKDDKMMLEESSSILMDSDPSASSTLSSSFPVKNAQVFKKPRHEPKSSSPSSFQGNTTNKNKKKKKKKKKRIIDRRKKIAVDGILTDCRHKIAAIEGYISAIISEEYNFTEASMRNSYLKARYSDAGAGKHFDMNFNLSNASTFFHPEEYVDATNPNSNSSGTTN